MGMLLDTVMYACFKASVDNCMLLNIKKGLKISILFKNTNLDVFFTQINLVPTFQDLTAPNPNKFWQSNHNAQN